jgi:hypothetical protein
MAHANANEATTEIDKDLSAMVRAGCRASDAEALREAVHTLFCASV